MVNAEVMDVLRTTHTQPGCSGPTSRRDHAEDAARYSFQLALACMLGSEPFEEGKGPYQGTMQPPLESKSGALVVDGAAIVLPRLCGKLSAGLPIV